MDEVSRLVEVWVNEVWDAGGWEEDEKHMQIVQEVWDDVHGAELLIGGFGMMSMGRNYL